MLSVGGTNAWAGKLDGPGGASTKGLAIGML